MTDKAQPTEVGVQPAQAQPECERCNLSPAEHDPMNWCDNQSFRHDDGSAQLGVTPPAPAAVAAPAAIAPGMKAAADLVQEQADLYIAEHAETDPDTGTVIWHHRDFGFDWHNGLEELAQKLLARAALAAAPAQEHATQLAGQGQFQQRVQPWLLECFGNEIAGDKSERNHRFLEEALELVQACGCTASEAHQLVDYVYGRPVGEPAQEVGGVMVTLAALCYANCLDMHAAGETELERISVPAIMAKIKAKQAAKPKHSPLPAAPDQAQDVQQDARDAGLLAFIEAVGHFKAQRLRVGSPAGAIRWDVEYGHYGHEARSKTLAEAIEKAIDAARAAQGGAA